ncbi:MAG: DUF4860 domain-containing protein [Clostridia bacterium]|nr:DUF4860 domain-containing protein [Clostridia bacterium]
MSKRGKKISHSMQGVFVFVLLGLFAVMSTLMVLLGAQMYRGTVDKAAENSEKRMLSAYVRSMVRAEDGARSVKVEEYGDIQALALYEDIDDEMYVTWIYLYEGPVYEQFTSADNEFEPDSGTEIAPATEFIPTLNEGLLSVFITDNEYEDCSVQIALRCPQDA